jgi:hypothetical protein
LLSLVLVESPALRGKQHHALPSLTGQPRLARRDVQRFNTFKDRFRLQDHAFAAAERAVVYRAMPIMRKGPQIVNFNVCQTSFPGPANDAIVQRPTKKIRKDRDNIDLHLAPSN